MIVKVGNPDNNYETTLIVRVSDLYKNYKQFPILIQVSSSYDEIFSSKLLTGN